MYDMYSWDQPASVAAEQPERTERAERTERPAPAQQPTAHQPAGDDRRAARAVQAALDRRDNGGDPGRTPASQSPPSRRGARSR